MSEKYHVKAEIFENVIFYVYMPRIGLVEKHFVVSVSDAILMKIIDTFCSKSPKSVYKL